MKIRLSVNEKTLTARLVDGPTTHDFVSLLPLTLPMNDLFRREKFGHLPRPISETGKHTHSYGLGDIAYWPPGPDIAVFYRHDGELIPDPGIIVIGKVISGLEALNVRGSVTVAFAVIGETGPVVVQSHNTTLRPGNDDHDPAGLHHHADPQRRG